MIIVQIICRQPIQKMIQTWSGFSMLKTEQGTNEFSFDCQFKINMRPTERMSPIEMGKKENSKSNANKQPFFQVIKKKIKLKKKKKKKKKMKNFAPEIFFSILYMARCVGVCWCVCLKSFRGKVNRFEYRSIHSKPNEWKTQKKW